MGTPWEFSPDVGEGALLELGGRLCTHILASEGDAHVERFEGNVETFEDDKVRRLDPDSIELKRVKYKKFAR